MVFLFYKTRYDPELVTGVHKEPKSCTTSYMACDSRDFVPQCIFNMEVTCLVLLVCLLGKQGIS